MGGDSKGIKKNKEKEGTKKREYSWDDVFAGVYREAKKKNNNNI